MLMIWTFPRGAKGWMEGGRKVARWMSGEETWERKNTERIIGDEQRVVVMCACVRVCGWECLCVRMCVRMCVQEISNQPESPSAKQTFCWKACISQWVTTTQTKLSLVIQTLSYHLQASLKYSETRKKNHPSDTCASDFSTTPCIF